MNAKHKKFTEGLVTFEGPAYTASFLPRKGSGVVHIEGAIHAGAWHAEFEKEPLAVVASSLLDEGTKTHSRETFRLTLETVGAQVTFWAGGRYLFFSILTTSKTLSETLKLTFEALTQPLLSEASVAEVIEREAAARVHDAENANEQAHRALSRVLYAPGSAGYEIRPEEEQEHTLKLSRENILQFIEETYRGRIVIAAIGDVEPSAFQSLLTSCTASWNHAPGASARGVSFLSSPKQTRELFVSIPGKESIDVYMGAAIRIAPSEPEFPALRVAVDLLGGGFSDHLMQTIRDRDGLTYGVLARIDGKQNQKGLHWNAWATFGNSLFEKGMRALKQELGIFLDKGITAKRLAEKLLELEGRYAVWFSKPQIAVREMRLGMLSHGNAAELDDYVQKLQTLTAKGVKETAQKHLRIDGISAAGAIDSNGKLL